ncbi:MAG: hypothetical protein Q8M20_06020 [Rhodocyclaceae bacterium]|nr:hypothetical protein [Rhodocyclaceae bacterium]MDZ4215004.1 DUF6776 family protein [Rhodocyclaceae bacterium]
MSWIDPSSRFAVKLRRLRSRYGITAPQLAIRPHLPWYVKALTLTVLAGLIVVAVVSIYDAGRRVVGYDGGELDKVVELLRTTNAELEEEVARMRSLLSGSESTLQIERSAQKLLSEQNGLLVAENARLKEDLAVFERLAKVEPASHSSGAPGGVSLDRISVRPLAPKTYQFSFLIALQGDRRGKESTFDLQLVISPRSVTGAKITLPASRADPDISQYQIALRNFRRIEGKFKVPEDFVPGKVEFVISEGGKLLASQSVSL